MILLTLLLSCSDPMAIALSIPPEEGRVVWGFLSTDGVRWSEPLPVAAGLSSLGLAAGQGELLVAGNQELRPPGRLEGLLGAPIWGLRFDGVQWHPHRWRVRDPQTPAFIDPQPFEGGMWYLSRGDSAVHDADPARAGAVSIRSADPVTVRFEGAGLADPSPVRHDGQLHVFATSGDDVLHLAGDPLVPVERLSGVTVPFALVFEDRLTLLAQQKRDGRRQPVISQHDGTGWSPWRALLDLHSLHNCTSPVMGPHPAGGWVALCVEERRLPVSGR